ncbi:hypothetical protein, partial [Pseudomonas shirazensis]
CVGSTVQVLLNAQGGSVGVNGQSHDEFLVNWVLRLPALAIRRVGAQRTFVIVIVVSGRCFSGFSKKIGGILPAQRIRGLDAMIQARI